MSDIFLSIIIPCFKVEKYLPRCIDSLRKQYIEGHGIEFIFVNDGSPDNLLELIREFRENDERVVLINQENHGVCSARNNGLAKARGKYVFFLDGDDWLTNEASKCIYDAAEAGCPDIIIMGNYKTYEGKEGSFQVWRDATKCMPVGTYDKSFFLSNTKSLPVSFKVYKKNFLLYNNIIFDESLVVGEVYTFFIHALAVANTIGVSDKFIMFYLHRKSGSATIHLVPQHDIRVLDTLSKINRVASTYCPEIRLNKSYKEALFVMVTYFSILKYVNHQTYNSEIGKFVNAIKQNSEYRELLESFVYGKYDGNYSILSIIILCIPSWLSYRILRLRRRLYLLVRKV